MGNATYSSRRPFDRFVKAALLLVCAAATWGSAGRSALAQETVNYASVSGRVTDPSSAVVAGARGDRSTHSRPT